MANKVVGFWVPEMPEYYFNRDEIPKIRAYYEATEQLSDRDLFDFKAIVREWWTFGVCDEESEKMVSSKVRKALRDYKFAVSRACMEKLSELSMKGVLVDAEQDH